MTEKDQDIERVLKFYIRMTWADSTCVPLLEHTSLLCAEKRVARAAPQTVASLG